MLLRATARAWWSPTGTTRKASPARSRNVASSSSSPPRVAPLTVSVVSLMHTTRARILSARSSAAAPRKTSTSLPFVCTFRTSTLPAGPRSARAPASSRPARWEQAPGSNKQSTLTSPPAAPTTAAAGVKLFAARDRRPRRRSSGRASMLRHRTVSVPKRPRAQMQESERWAPTSTTTSGRPRQVTCAGSHFGGRGATINSAGGTVQQATMSSRIPVKSVLMWGSRWARI
mmetsp:Transcript_66403/g.151973  ORF Transcript_66403/g.151973 Transcript_66403/m.151973 type:complete len:230 (-) Transcript_66403:1129-1818(-)